MLRTLVSKVFGLFLENLINNLSISPSGDDNMIKGLIAIAFGALLTGCEEPKFEGEIDTYAPACDNKPYVTVGFDSFTIECGEYFFEHFENSSDCGSKLEQQSQTS